MKTRHNMATMPGPGDLMTRDAHAPAEFDDDNPPSLSFWITEDNEGPDDDRPDPRCPIVDCDGFRHAPAEASGGGVVCAFCGESLDVPA